MEHNRTLTLESQNSVSFYDEIAVLYNEMLEKESSNKMVRQTVADKFAESVKSGRVLDFGGGTGLDLEWLSRGNYSILFCEPSNGMRRQARHHNNDNVHYEDIVFLDDTRVDFSKWNAEMPFINRVDGILANFAVINCIKNLNLLFSNLSLVIKPGGHVLAIVLNRNLSKHLKSHFGSAIKSLFSGSPIQFKVRFNAHKHPVYVHSFNEMKRAASPYFEWQNPENINGSDFSLVHLVRK